MAFEIDHDWEGNLATPTARIGEKVKLRLLILLCGIWILLGLLMHQPWKPEADALSVIDNLLNSGNLLSAHASSEQAITHPPLYYLVASAFAKIFGSWLAIHDAARLSNALWMTLSLLIVGMIGRELWESGTGRQTTFILLSCIGLISGVHLINPQVAGLTGSIMGFYALALAHRRPYRAAALLAGGLSIIFLSTGWCNSIILTSSAIALPILFSNWRNRTYLTCLCLGLVGASLAILLWMLAAWYWQPTAFSRWWGGSEFGTSQLHYDYFLRTLAWFSWPALPLALWGVWVYRQQLLIKPKFQLILCFFILAFVALGACADNVESSAYPLLIPLVALASGSVEKLKRGAAGALNWFGLVLFALIGILIWLGWIAVNFGWPTKLNERMLFLSGISDYQSGTLSLIIAVFATIVWIATVNAKRSNRAAVTDWAVGITMAWSLLMTLWLPFLDSAKSYLKVATEIQQTLPRRVGCINTIGLSSQHINLLNYYLHVRLKTSEWYQQPECNLLLVRTENRYSEITPSALDWKLVLKTKRPAERKERFVLFEKINHHGANSVVKKHSAS
jgi:4-amino-4-deoxy-L-arabinose transferase-like glycosyltransferase